MLDSTGALDLPEIPKSMLVIGGGYIGLELGSVYAALGTKVSVVEMTPGLLPGADRDLVRFLAQRVEKTFDKVMLSTKVTVDEGVGQERHRDVRGRGRAEGSDLRLRAGLDRPAAEREDRRASTRPRSRSTPRASSRPTASAAPPSRRSSRSATSPASRCWRTRRRTKRASRSKRSTGHKAVFEPAAIPAVVFTDPEIAWAGLTEAEAEKQGRKVEVAKFPWPASGRAIAIDRVDGMTKLLIDPETERILGVGIVGSGAGELIAEGVLAIEMGATASDVKLTIHPHPTLTETVMEVGRSVLRPGDARLQAQEEILRGGPSDGPPLQRSFSTFEACCRRRNQQPMCTRHCWRGIRTESESLPRCGSSLLHRRVGESRCSCGRSRHAPATSHVT